ncbi:MAG: hypothetical protein ACOC8F_00145 [Planctomycetota bacterium]
MTLTLAALTLTAATLGFLHTVAGPDHYVPFIVMARARRWSYARAAGITALCGLGHVGSSVVVGLLGVALGLTLGAHTGGRTAASRTVEGIIETLPGWMKTAEGVRGDLAAWLLMGFGLAYAAWGLRRALRARSHAHNHDHDGASHTHNHTHTGEHGHVHATPGRPDGRSYGRKLTPWVLFIIFVTGICEPLIPLVVASAAVGPGTVIVVTGVFSGVTIATMTGAVLVGTSGLKLLPLRWFERYTHALAGAAICFCGAGMVFLGL